MTIKQVTGMITFAKNETSYLSGAITSGSTDTIHTAQPFAIYNIDYSFDGARKAANWSGGKVRGTTPSGKTVTGTVTLETKGSGATYTTSVTPPMHVFVQASGFSGSLASGAWSYTPNPLGTVPKSLYIDAYDRGELLSIYGAYCDWGFKSEGAGIVSSTFKVMGLPSGSITDVAVPPARVFTAANVIPPKCANIALSIDSYTTANVRSFEYAHNLTITPRMNLNASGSFSGYAIAGRAPLYKVTIEADALSSFNPYTDRDNATLRALTMTVGAAGTNNSFTVSMPQCTLSKVTRSNDGDTLGLWELEYTPAISAPDANDDVQVTFNA